MSGDSRKREASSSPDGERDRSRQRDTSPTHLSVTRIQTTPVSATRQVTNPLFSPTNNDLPHLATPALTPPNEITLDSLYRLFLGQEERLLKQEQDSQHFRVQMVQKDREISELKAEIATLKNPPAPVQSENGVDPILTPPVVIPATLPGSQQQVVNSGNRDPEAEARDLAVVSEGLSAAEGEIENLKNQITSLKRSSHLESEKHEQYSRRDSIIVRGVPYKRGENTNRIMCQIGYSLGIQISESDISVSHRTGRSGVSGHRPILCKLARRDVKHQLLRNKRLAADIKHDEDGNPVRIFLDEDLTSMRARVCRKLREDRINHYTRDGKIYVQDQTDPNKQNMINTPDDFLGLNLPDSLKQELGIYPSDC